MLYSKESIHLFQGPSRTATLDFTDKEIEFVNPDHQCEYPTCSKMTFRSKYVVKLDDALTEIYLCDEHYKKLMIENKVRWDIMLEKSTLGKKR